MESANKAYNEGLLPSIAGTGSFIFPVENSPNMLGFGEPYEQGDKPFGEYKVIAKKSGIISSDSSSVSSTKSKSQNGEAKIEQKKRYELGLGSVPGSNLVSRTSSENRKRNKKAKTDNPTSTGSAKAKKENIGERITALQQLVSPFGKTDTASVLHETAGYIKFLHDQVQVLSSPYMQKLPSSHGNKAEEDESKYDLRSRGLCLVPVAWTTMVANTNGADFWSSAMASDTNSKQ